MKEKCCSLGVKLYHFQPISVIWVSENTVLYGGCTAEFRVVPRVTVIMCSVCIVNRGAHRMNVGVRCFFLSTECVRCLEWPLLRGDLFYNYRCSICTRGPEYLRRLRLSWVDVADLLMYQLHLTQPNKEFFQTRSEIFPYLDSIWSLLQVPHEVRPLEQNYNFMTLAKYGCTRIKNVLYIPIA